MIAKPAAHEESVSGSLDAVEVTAFRLKGCTCAEFVKANAEVDERLGRQPGFRSQRIA